MRTTYASKSLRQGGTAQTKRYWYYTSKPLGAKNENGIERLPAEEIERLVLSSLKSRLRDKAWLADQIAQADVAEVAMVEIVEAADAQSSKVAADESDPNERSLSGLIDRIETQKDRLRIRLNLGKMLGRTAVQSPILANFEVPYRKRQNGSSRPIVIVPEDAPQPDPDLIALVADARRWACEILDGKSQTIQQITEREGLRSGTVSRVLPLAWLAPDITTAILEGRQPAHLTAKSLRSLPELPVDWKNQRRILGFSHHKAS